MDNTFQDLVKSHEDFLKQQALSLAGNDFDADDLVQETLLKVWKYQHKFKEGTNLKSWLYTILKNVFYNSCNKNKKQRHLIQRYAIHQKVFKPIQSFSVHDETQNILDVLDKHIPFDYLAAMKSTYVYNLSYKDTAEILEVPIGTVMSRIHRCRRQARDILLNEYGACSLNDLIEKTSNTVIHRE